MTSTASDQTSRPPSTRFTVDAAAEPQAMPRVLELFALRSLVPARWHAERNGEGLRIDIEIEGLGSHEAGLIARRLDQMVLVERVLMRAADGARAGADRAAAAPGA